LSQQLKDDLGKKCDKWLIYIGLNWIGVMKDETSAPPWLLNMQRFGPPPSYPNLKVSHPFSNSILSFTLCFILDLFL